MEYKRDLLKDARKSKFQVGIGVLFLALSILWVITIFVDFQVIRPFNWIDTLLFGLLGIVHIFGGLGYSVGRFFGKAFIDIDSDRMKFKLGIFDKEQKINWQDITAIDYKPNAFMISQGDNKTQVIKISKLDYSSISEVKAVISKIAADKQVDYSIA